MFHLPLGSTSLPHARNVIISHLAGAAKVGRLVLRETPIGGVSPIKIAIHCISQSTAHKKHCAQKGDSTHQE